MPLFVFLSGAIYYLGRVQLGKYNTLDVLFEKKFKRLIVPYFFAAVLFMVPMKLLGNYYSFESLPKAISDGLVLTLDSGHLWYVFMLFVIFLLFYLLEKFINRIFTPVNIILLVLLHLNSNSIPIDVFQIKAASKYLVFFYLGYLFQRHKEEILNIVNKRKFIYLLGMSVYFIVLFRYLRYVPQNVMDILLLFVAVLGISSSYLFVLNVMNLRIFKTKIPRSLNKHNFEIYLLHDPINYVLLAIFAKYNMFIWFQANGFNTAIFVAIRFLVTLISPILIMMVVTKIRNKFLPLFIRKSKFLSQ